MKQDINNELWSSIYTIFYNKLPLEIINNIYQKILFKPSNKRELRDAVDAWCENKRVAIRKYGDIKYWDTSKITDMSELFSNKKTFDDNISLWDVSNVKNMSLMFRGAKSFNQPIGSWNVFNVKNMKFMFCEASSFNQPIGDWNVFNVANMSFMFYKAKSFDQNLDNWNINIQPLPKNVFVSYK